MAKMTESLTGVAEAKRKYDQEVAGIDAEMRYRKQNAKAAVLTALQEALESDQSVNAIAIKGMGYASPGTTALKSFVGATGTSREAILSALGVTLTGTPVVPIDGAEPVTNYKFTVDTVNPTMHYVNGDKNNTIPVINGEAKFSLAKPAEERAAIAEAFKVRYGDKYRYQEV